MPTVTNQDIRRQLQQVVTRNTPLIAAGTTGNSENPETPSNISIEQKQFKQLKGEDTIICLDGTTATLLQPLPFVKWHCVNSMDSSGISTLTDTLDVVILTIDKKGYVLGFPSRDCGFSEELELLVDMGDTEVVINNEYISTKSKATVKDGIEQ